MALSKANNRERMRKERSTVRSSRLHVQLKITPDIADYLEVKAGEKTVEEYLLTQLERAVRLHVQPKNV